MKRVLSLLLVLLLLCGCTSAPAAVTTVPTVVPGPDILDNKIPLDSIGAIFDTGVRWGEEEAEPMLYSLEGDLLLLLPVYRAEAKCDIILRRISTQSGEILQERILTTKGFGAAQVYGSTVCVCSPSGGKVWILDAQLNVQVEYTLQENYDDWFVAPDLKSVYQISWLNGINRCNLATGAVSSLLDQYSDVSYLGQRGNIVSFTYVDSETQMTCSGYLDLATGQIHKIYTEGSFSDYFRETESWLSSASGEETTYLLGNSQGQIYSFANPDSYAYFTERGDILNENISTGRYTLYDQAGKFLAQFQLPMGRYGPNGYIGDLVWDSQRNGYFLMYYTVIEILAPEEDVESDIRIEPCLAFLSVETGAPGKDLPLENHVRDFVPAGVATEAAVFERAAQIGERYGVRILVADQCLVHYDSFDTVIVTDPDTINQSLTELEKALCKYPEGFFEQLHYDRKDLLEFSLVGNLIPLREDEYGQIAAFAQPLADKYIIVADAYTANDTTFHHELSHVIDHRLQWDTDHSADALYSESTWDTLNPKGFTYDQTYALHHDRWNFNDRYFISSYSLTYQTEDRAVIFEQAMVGNDYPFGSGPIREKLEYYCECIRDCFDTTGWPEVLPWEEVLQ